MLYRTLADLVMVLHLGFVVFVAAGGLLVLRWRRVAFAHLPAALWGVWIEVSGGVCPLTPLENALRRAAGERTYAGGFIEHYLQPLLYPSGLSRPGQLLLAAAVASVNVAVYTAAWRRHRRAG